MTLRRITPIPHPGITTPNLGPKPEVKWVAPTDLYVDDTYQRGLSRRSGDLIAKMIRTFAWNRMKLPTVVRAEGGLHVIDGQHTAIVAATLKVPEIPVFIVLAEKLDERARAFVGLNTDRISVAPLDIFNALVASGDPAATEVKNVCIKAKVRLKFNNQSTVVAEGDTMAIGTIRQLVSRRGNMVARQILEMLVKAKCMPISAAQIKAAEHIVCVERRGVDLEKLARIIRIDGDAGLRSAMSHSKIAKVPLWRALAARWVEKVPNVRRVA